jgi:hypothetical protein
MASIRRKRCFGRLQPRVADGTRRQDIVPVTGRGNALLSGGSNAGQLIRVA